MKKRKTFLVRWLIMSDKDQMERSVIDIEHIQSGDKQRVSSIEDAAQWMKSDKTQQIIQNKENE